MAAPARPELPARQAPAQRVRRSAAGSRRSGRRRLLIAAGGLLVGLVLLVVGFNLWLFVSEWLDPSGRVFVVVDGKRHELVRPATLATPATAAPVPATSAAAATAGAEVSGLAGQAPLAPAAGTPAEEADPASAAGQQVPLPPLRVTIPAIEVDVPVVLATSDRLPRVPVVGWFFQSAYPGTASNSVLLGHVDGNAAVFGRLHELRPGDTIRVTTRDAVHVYVVETNVEVAVDAVDVLLPTPEALLTVITCAGDWDAESRSYDRRLVVRARYAAVEPLARR